MPAVGNEPEANAQKKKKNHVEQKDSQLFGSYVNITQMNDIHRP